MLRQPAMFSSLLKFLVFGIVAIFIGIVLVIVFGVGLDSLLSLRRDKPTLDCFHCGMATPANEKTCENCGEELQ